MTKFWPLAIVALFSALAGAQKTPIIQPHQTFVDDSGSPCAGCLLHTYAAGTTTPLATYSDPAGTPNQNPVVLDTAGGAVIWTGSGAYKFELDSAAGSLIWTTDNVPGSLFGGGTFTGAITAPQFNGPLAGAVTGHASLDCALTGCTMSGAMVGSVTGHASLDLPLTGGTMTGPLNGIPMQGYNTNARTPLAGFLFSRNEAFTQQPINIVLLGDSQTICYNALTACATGPAVDFNRWAEQLRITLQGMYGSHGTGMVPLVVNVTNLAVNAQYWSISGSVTTSTILGPSQASSIATGGSLVQMANAQVATFHSAAQYTTPIPFDHFNVYCATNASSGSIAVNIDGTGVGTACGTPTGSPTAHVATFTAASGLGNHTVTLTSTGTSYLYAGEGTAGTAGISVHNLGTASAAAEYFGTTVATQLAFSDVIPGSTQLAILDLGTNDANSLFGYSTTSYSTAMQAIITHELTGLGASVLVVQPPVSNVTSGVTNWPLFTAALTTVVNANAVSYVNLQSRWGTTYNSNYYCADGIHPCDFGSLDEASMIIASIVDQRPPLPMSTSTQQMNVSVNGANPGPSPAGTAAANISSSVSPSIATAALSVLGGTNYSLAAFGTGTSSGLPATAGFYDPNTLVFPWNTNVTDDICFGTPLSGANVAACAGTGFHYQPAIQTLTVNNLTVGGLCTGCSTGANATSIQSTPVSSTPPTTGQIIAFNGTSYAPAAAAAGAGNVNAGTTSQFAYYGANGTTVSGINTVPSGAVVGDTDTQTLTGKTLTNDDANTQTAGNNTTKLATTAFVQAAVVGATTGVSSIDTQTGAFTFAGTGVSHTGNAYTFTSAGSVTDISISIASFAIPANSCYGSSGSATPATATMTGVTTSMAVLPSFITNPTAIVGWGTTGGLNLLVWPSASNTVSYCINNATSGSITGGAITLRLAAQ